MSEALDLNLVGQDLPETTSHYSPHDCALYALSVGAQDLRYTWEEHPQFAPLPSMAVLAPTSLVFDGLRSLRANFQTLVHGAQSITLHRPLPPEAVLRTRGRITQLLDKGKSAVALFETQTYEQGVPEATGPLFSTRWSIFMRGQGGFGGARGEAEALPERTSEAPIAQIAAPTRPDQALLYRLNGDTNPLHVDPQLAERAGFKAPILHGLCTYGFAVDAALKALAEGDGAQLERFSARFANVVYPGETLTTTLWPCAAPKTYALEVQADGRTVLDQGVLVLR